MGSTAKSRCRDRQVLYAQKQSVASGRHGLKLPRVAEFSVDSWTEASIFFHNISSVS